MGTSIVSISLIASKFCNTAWLISGLVGWKLVSQSA